MLRKYIFYGVLLAAVSRIYAQGQISLSMPASFNDFAYGIDWQKQTLRSWLQIAQQLPLNFKIGTATSAQQLEGLRTHDGYAAGTDHQGFVQNNWTSSDKWGSFYNKNIGPNHWQLYEQDINLIANTGNAYRLSIPWDKIQPDGPDLFDSVALAHYKDLIQKLVNRGITVYVCLFHFTLPIWFAQKGGFEHEENIADFVKFGMYVMQHLNNGTVTHWASYNEPIAYACEAYMTNKFPPHDTNSMYARVKSMYRTGIVVRNMMRAHIKLYQAAKEINAAYQFGLIHMFIPMDPYNGNVMEKKACQLANDIIVESVLGVFKTGTFNWVGLIKHEMPPEGKHALDWIGVNYYTHEYLCIDPLRFKFFARSQAKPGEPVGPDNGKAIYPDGLYRAIVSANTIRINIPMFISEIGISDKHSTKDAEGNYLFDGLMKKYMHIVLDAINNGINIQGIFIWTLIDSLGWKGSRQSFYGLYACDPETKKRTLRPSVMAYVDELVHAYKQR